MVSCAVVHPSGKESAMLLRAFLRLLGVAALCVLPCLLHADDADVEQAADEKTLKDARVAADGASLLNFLKKRTLADMDFDRLRGAVHLLGDDDFQIREKATADLQAAG